MNYLKLPGICLAFKLLCTLNCFAQDESRFLAKKPLLFTNLPDSIPVTVSELNRLINNAGRTQADVNLRSADSSMPAFSGSIVSSVSRYENKVRSVVIRSRDFKGAALTLSSFTNPDGTVSYRGRIVSFNHGDAYELEERNGQYALIKKNFYRIVTE